MQIHIQGMQVDNMKLLCLIAIETSTVLGSLVSVHQRCLKHSTLGIMHTAQSCSTPQVFVVSIWQAYLKHPSRTQGHLTFNSCSAASYVATTCRSRLLQAGALHSLPCTAAWCLLPLLMSSL